MRRAAPLAVLGLVGLAAYAFFFFDPMGRAWVSPDGSVKLEKYYDRPWQAFFGDSDSASAGMRIVDRAGVVRFDTGLVSGGGTPNEVVALPRLFGVSGATRGPHGISPMLIDLNGQPVRQLTREEFFALADGGQIWAANAEERDVIDRLAAKIGVAGEERWRLVSLAAAIPFDSRTVGWAELRTRILASDDLRFDYAAAVVGDLEASDAKKFLHENFFSHPDRAAQGLDLLRNAEKIAEGDRRALVQPWFGTRDPKTALAVIGAWQEAEGPLAPAFKMAADFYYRAPPGAFYNSYEHPRNFLQALYDLGGPEDPAVHKAVLFGLQHASEGFWRSAFYLVRDEGDLPVAPFAEALRALRDRERGDELLARQTEQVLNRK